MGNFIGMVFATLNNEGVDTKNMSAKEAVEKYNELQGGGSKEQDATPAEKRKIDNIKADDIFNKTTSVYSYNEMLEEQNKANKYYEEHKNRKAEIQYMTPDEYIRLCAERVFDDVSPAELEKGRLSDKESIDYLTNQIKEGKKFDMPYLNLADKGQEGLHRAVIAKQMGIDKIPVVMIDSVDKERETLDKQVEKNKDISDYVENKLSGIKGYKYDDSSELINDVFNKIDEIKDKDKVNVKQYDDLSLMDKGILRYDIDGVMVDIHIKDLNDGGVEIDKVTTQDPYKQVKRLNPNLKNHYKKQYPNYTTRIVDIDNVVKTNNIKEDNSVLGRRTNSWGNDYNKYYLKNDLYDNEYSEPIRLEQRGNNYKILDGNHRFIALQNAGYKKAEVLVKR